MVSFSDPTLSPKNQDMAKDWFVYFREYRDGRTKLHVFKDGLNTKDVKKNKRERIKIANALIFDLRDMIREGIFNPQQRIEYVNLCDSLDEMIRVKESALKRKTINGYNDTIRIFKNWLIDQGYKDILPEKFTNRMANMYLEYLLKERKYSGCSHNNHLGDFKNFFNWIFKRDRDRFRGIENPFNGITPLPESEGKIYALTPEERRKIEVYLKKRKDPFYYCCCFMYYLAIRRPDLANIRVEDVDLNNRVVRLYSSASKNRRQQAVRVTPEFYKILLSMELGKYPGHYYLFGRGFEPSEEKLTRVNDFTEYFRDLTTKLKINPVKTFYSFKNSGLSDLYTATKDILLVQRHARHSDPRITMTYLRSLGLMIDDAILEADIKF